MIIEHQPSTHSESVLLIQKYIEILLGRVNRKLVRDSIESVNSFPVLSINNFKELFINWGFETAALKIDANKLSSINIPILVACHREENFIGGSFVLLYRIDENDAVFYSPSQGECRIDKSIFLANYTGVSLIVLNSPDILHELKLDDDSETHQVHRYKTECIEFHDNFLSSEQCGFLIKYAEKNTVFERSKVLVEDQGLSVESIERTSFTTRLPDRNNVDFTSIYQKVSSLLQVPITHIETLQCIRYNINQQFKAHFDSGLTNHRLHTLLIYLNDQFEGGETFFPELDLKFHPKEGGCLYFRNRDSENRIIFQSIHCGLPVKKGIKYACNIWVRDRPFV